MTNQQMQKRLNAVIEEMRQSYHVPSIMVSVTRQGETFYCGGGIADVTTGASADENTVYAIASASKAFIATSVCMLADAGRLSLDAPVRTYLRDFKMYDPYMTEHLTLRDAMSRLREREKQILALRFHEGKTQMEVAREIGISQAQVSRLEKNAIGSIRKAISS